MAIAMDASNAPPIQQSYPSPTAGPITDGNGPFFNQQQPRDQQRLPDPDPVIGQMIDLHQPIRARVPLRRNAAKRVACADGVILRLFPCGHGALPGQPTG